jgi:hypothetical protein
MVVECGSDAPDANVERWNEANAAHRAGIDAIEQTRMCSQCDDTWAHRIDDSVGWLSFTRLKEKPPTMHHLDHDTDD